VRRIEKAQHIAAVGCKLLSMQHEDVLDSVGGCGLRYWRGFTDIGRGEVDLAQYDDGPIAPFSICGAAALVRTAVFNSIGGFDGRFFAYFEDVDFSWRLRLLGYEIEYEPAAKVAHYLSGTAGREEGAWKVYLMHRNLLRMLLKNCGPSLPWAIRNYLLLYTVVTGHLLFYHPAKALAILRGMFWNLRNFRSTYSERTKIQSRRTVSERTVLAAMYPMYAKNSSTMKGAFGKLLNSILNKDWFSSDRSVERN
jgi:GT2 family glycosyltransferase